MQILYFTAQKLYNGIQKSCAKLPVRFHIFQLRMKLREMDVGEKKKIQSKFNFKMCSYL